jgi:glutathione S-transferase
MVLYTCEDAKKLAGLGHPCAKAALALDEAGHTYEHKMVKGGTLKLWTLPNRSRDRAEIEKISGQKSVPILVLDDGEVIVGSGTIIRWAREHAPTASA